MSVVIVNDTDPEVTVSLKVSCCHEYCCEGCDTDLEVTVSLMVGCCHGYCYEGCNSDTDLEVTVTHGRLLPWILL